MSNIDETVLTETVGNEWCDYRLIKCKYKGKWTNPILEYNDYRGTGNDEWGEVQLFEHFSKGDIAYLKEKFGMDFPLTYEDTVEELIDTNDLVAFKECRTSMSKEIKDLVDDLGWEYQRMTSSGRATYKKLCRKLGWEFEWDDEKSE